MYIVIAGAGLVGRGLAGQLVKARHDVVIIDKDREVCEWVASRLGAMAVCGGATSIDILRQAGIDKTDVAVCTMRMDADNLAFAVLAKSFGVQRVIARLRNPEYESAYRMAGVNTTVHVADVFASQLLLEIEESHLRQVYSFGAGQASIVVDTVPDGAAASGKSVSEIGADAGFPDECVITGIYRPKTQTFIIPRGKAQILSGDRVFMVASHPNLRHASKYLHKKA
ncbi:MAG TPA: TrkA family potassium uptake protein [Phycisphaerae bacterium]|nr:TrkA family potassium uptake protein [Phycisphaerae bacterium]